MIALLVQSSNVQTFHIVACLFGQLKVLQLIDVVASDV